jgi:hypothetical protein
MTQVVAGGLLLFVDGLRAYLFSNASPVIVTRQPFAEGQGIVDPCPFVVDQTRI